ncbi:MAG: septation protein IspZ [Xanthobacteraceae bacterium]|nr:septation protein IspZ [Xanthobacteraceae bacterium]
MIDVFRRLTADFLSTIAFVAVLLISGNVLLATAFAVVSSIAQFAYVRATGKTLNAMAWASLGLVIVLGGATFLTNDPRFVLMKPAIAHFAIGAIMLKPGWMSRYMPPVVLDVAPKLPLIAGYCWAVLMFVLGAGTIAVALTGDLKLWTLYVSVVAVGAKVAAFAIQYAAFRIIIARRLARRAVAAAG